MVLNKLHQSGSEVRREAGKLSEHVQQHDSQLGRISRCETVWAQIRQVLGDETEIPQTFGHASEHFELVGGQLSVNFHVRAHTRFIPLDEAIKERYVADAELHESVYEIDTILRLET